MLRLVVLLVAAVAFSNAAVKHCCSAGDRHNVQEQWSALWEDQESSRMKIGFGRMILEKLMELKPETKDLFKNVNGADTKSGEFAAHCMRILTALDMLINMLDDPEALESGIEHLAEQHSKRAGVKKEHFAVFGQILEKGLPRILPKFDYLSWKSCLKGLLTKIAHKLN